MISKTTMRKLRNPTRAALFTAMFVLAAIGLSEVAGVIDWTLFQVWFIVAWSAAINLVVREVQEMLTLGAPPVYPKIFPVKRSKWYG